MPISYSERHVYAALMVGEWIESVEQSGEKRADVELVGTGKVWKNDGARHNRAWVLLSEEYPYLHAIRENEGMYGFRRISTHLGYVIEEAFDIFDSDDAETLLQGEAQFDPDAPAFGGVGCFDFELVPKCCEHAMELQKSAMVLGSKEEVEITIAQMYRFMWEQFPDGLKPKRKKVVLV